MQLNKLEHVLAKLTPLAILAQREYRRLHNANLKIRARFPSGDRGVIGHYEDPTPPGHIDIALAPILPEAIGARNERQMRFAARWLIESRWTTWPSHLRGW